MHEVQCENCDAFISAPSDAVAGKFRCPHCRAVNLVPPELMTVASGSVAERTGTEIDLVSLDDELAPDSSAGLAIDQMPDEEEAVDAWAEEPTRCPACGAPLTTSGVQCLACGYNKSLGRVVAVQVERIDPVRELTGLTPLAGLIGLILAVTCAGIWTACVLLSGQPLGYAALGFAAVLGLAVPNLAETRGWRVGLSCVALVLLSLVLGKVLILGFATTALAASDVTESPELMEAAVTWEMTEQRSFPQELQQAIDELDVSADPNQMRIEAPGTIAFRVRQAVVDRIDAMSPAERRDAATKLLARHPDLSRLQAAPRSAVSAWDFVWFAAALYIAYRLGAGRRPIRRKGLVSDTGDLI